MQLSASQSSVTSLSQLLKACGDTLRVQILQVLRTDTYGVLELTQLFETKQSGMSHHLKVLNKVGLVEAQREGNAIFYRRPFNPSGEHDQEAIEKLFQLIDRIPMDESLNKRIANIREQRAEQSQAFFAKNVERFKAQQELICDYEQYAQASYDLLVKSDLSASATVLEIGPGDGRFLKLLSNTFKDVIALDNSQEMLRQAKQFAQQEQLNNVEFYLGETSAFEHKGIANAIVMNMVLHHVATPAEIFSDCASILKPSGVLVVCDLSHHNQEWAKENCGDLWLGFEPTELNNWAGRAGLINNDSLLIGLRNGFQIQLHQFIKPEISH